MDYVIRPLTAEDEPILWEMLYQALQTSEGAPPRDVVRQPQFARHAEGWGRAGDTGFVAYDPKQKDNCWARFWLRLAGDQLMKPKPHRSLLLPSNRDFAAAASGPRCSRSWSKRLRNNQPFR
jgi:hypothetical protein